MSEIKTWKRRITEEHSNSDPQYWPVGLMFKYANLEIAELRAALAKAEGERDDMEKEVRGLAAATIRPDDSDILTLAYLAGYSKGKLAGATPVPEGWQPIETAPKDGTYVLVCRAFDADGNPMAESFGLFTQRAAWWADEGQGEWIVYCSLPCEPGLFFDPTHWMPLPAAPRSTS